MTSPGQCGHCKRTCTFSFDFMAFAASTSSTPRSSHLMFFKFTDLMSPIGLNSGKAPPLPLRRLVSLGRLSRDSVS